MEVSEEQRRGRELAKAIDSQALLHYKTLKERDIKSLVVDDKWHSAIATLLRVFIGARSQRLESRVSELAQRYEVPVSRNAKSVAEFESRVAEHLADMGFQA